MNDTNTKTKYFFLSLSVLIFLAVLYTYYDTLYLKRFDIFLSEDDVPTYSDFKLEIISLTKSYVY